MSGDRVLSTFTMLALQIAALGVVFFWAIGAVLLFTNNGGQILDVNLTSFWRTVYFSFPLLVVFLSPIAWLLFFRKADLMAQGILSAPLGILLFMYLFYVMSNKPF